jgi:hypothetical protein
MNRIAIAAALVALAQPAVAQEPTQVYVNADGQITQVAPPTEPGYLKYQYQPVECVTLPCPNYFVLALDSPDADGVVVWSDEQPPEILWSKKVAAAMRNPDDAPACWVIRGELIIEEVGTTLRIDKLVGSCS